LIDSHCHLADEAFEADLEAVVARALAAGVGAGLVVLDATCASELARAAEIARLWPAARFAVGVHPHQAGQFTGRLADVEPALLAALAAQPQARAVGEIGLDYHYGFAPREVQREVFSRQLRLARARQWPVVIHTREADEDTLAVVREESGGELQGVFHCFTGASALARQVLDLGFHVSFSGIVTFKNAAAIRDAARLVPADRLLAETDAPYLAPVPHRGARNEPAWVGYVVQALADVRGEAASLVAAAVTRAFETLFRP